MSLQQKPLGIVVGVDGSPASAAAVAWAARDAEMRNVRLTLVHVVPPVVAGGGFWPQTPVPGGVEDLQEDQARQVIEDSRTTALDVGSPDRAEQVHSEVRNGQIVPTLIELSKDADLLVVGCRGQGALARALLGSVSSAVVHHAHCPVAVIHDEDPATASSPEAPVVVGVDGSPASELATAIAFDEAARRGVELVAVHAWSDEGLLNFGTPGRAPIEWANVKEREEAVLGERLSGWLQRYPDVAVRRVVVSDRPAPRLLEQAENAQLLVVGSHGRGGFTGMLLGSVSRTVVNSARIPVIIAR